MQLVAAITQQLVTVIREQIELLLLKQSHYAAATFGLFFCSCYVAGFIRGLAGKCLLFIQCIFTIVANNATVSSDA
jgi:hypothetical protein